MERLEDLCPEAEIRQLAVEVMGSEASAATWMCKRSMWLDGQRPIDLLQSKDGTQSVRDYLVRLFNGVCS